jgi:hypothetical protein
VGLRLYFLSKELTSSNPSLTATNVVCCTQFEISYGIMASIAPCLKTFMSPYERPLADPTKYQHYGNGNSTSHTLSSLPPNSRNEGPAVSGSIEEDDRQGLGRLGKNFQGTLRPEQNNYDARVVTTRHQDGPGDRLSEDSGNSRRLIIIKKAVEWTVDYGSRNPSRGSKDDDPCTIEEVHAPRER